MLEPLTEASVADDAGLHHAESKAELKERAEKQKEYMRNLSKPKLHQPFINIKQQQSA